MEFYLKINNSSLHQFNPNVIRFKNRGDLALTENELILLDDDQHTKVICFCDKQKTSWIIGDPVIEKDKHGLIEKQINDSSIQQLLETIQGHYRIIVYDRSKNSISIASSLFGILPVYYCEKGNITYISSEMSSLSDYIGDCRIDKRFVLENILFYYQLFNHTLYKEIKLLPTHNELMVTAAGLSVSKFFNISDWFVTKPSSWKKSTKHISDLFIERSRQYFPDETYISALTGGFDSRTLVGCSLYHQQIFETYGFGNEFSDDIKIASELAKKAGLKFNNIELNQKYIKSSSLHNGLEFILNSEGTAGFARAHYLFACKELKGKTKYLITGNFGSEIFRAVHNTGAVISPNLFLLFNLSYDDAIEKIKNSQEFNWINKENFEKEWTDLKDELSKLPIFSPKYSHLSKNEKLYLFVFEEVFRKYFGAEMVNQFKYLNNRTPFLDSFFLKEFLKTELAGVYSDFQEKNPLKRYKGQILYAHLIKKTFPEFSGIVTNKGYRPVDLMTRKGNFLIARQFIKKLLKKRKPGIDPNSVDEAFEFNQFFFQKQPCDKEIFNEIEFSNVFHSKNFSHDFLIALSQLWYINECVNKKEISKIHEREKLFNGDK